MKIKPTLQNIANSLRQQAEAIITAKASDSTKYNVDHSKTLIYELEVHQVELEIQNEELRKSQLDLADARDRYVELYEFSPVAYLILDETGKICKANLKAEEILSTPRRFIIDSGLAQYIDPSSQDDFYFHRKFLFTSFDKQVSELCLHGYGNGKKIVRIESTAIISHTDKCKHSHTVLVDITKEKAAENALKTMNIELEQEVKRRTAEITKNRDFLYTILNTATDAIITIDELGIIENTNPATEVMFGFSNKELVAGNISMLIPEANSSHHDNYIANYFKTDKASKLKNTEKAVSPLELTAKRKNGSRFPISLSINRMNETPCFTCIIRDASERISLEKEVLRGIEDERHRISRDLHDSIGQNIVGVSMKALSIANQLKKDGDKKSLVFGEFSENLDIISKHIRLIVSDLALFDLDNHEIADLVHLIVKTYKGACKTTIVVNIPEKVKISDVVVATQLLRITQEGLNNALKHAKATKITISLIQNDQQTVLSIVDDGKGMNPSSIPNFHTSVDIGYGFGNMRYRAHVIGADLEVISDKGKGTGIYCTIYT